MFAIYQVTNKVNQKKYIGFTTRGIDIRKSEHLKMASGGSNYRFHSSIRKYGFSSFIWEILEEGWNSEIGMNVREPFWISQLKPEYNMTEGGGGSLGCKGYKHTKEQRRVRSVWMMGKRHSLGTKHTPEYKEKQRKSHQGQIPWNKGKTGVQVAWNKGLKVPGISARQLGRIRGPNKTHKSQVL